jgi:hypothetical protein
MGDLPFEWAFVSGHSLQRSAHHGLLGHVRPIKATYGWIRNVTAYGRNAWDCSSIGEVCPIYIRLLWSRVRSVVSSA